MLTGKQIAPNNGWESARLYDTFDAIEAFKLPPAPGASNGNSSSTNSGGSSSNVGATMQRRRGAKALADDDIENSASNASLGAQQQRRRRGAAAAAATHETDDATSASHSMPAPGVRVRSSSKPSSHVGAIAAGGTSTKTATPTTLLLGGDAVLDSVLRACLARNAAARPVRVRVRLSVCVREETSLVEFS